MTHKSHLALILPIAIREPRETKKINLWISLGHESTASGLLTDLQQPSLLYYYHYAGQKERMQTVNHVGWKA